MLWWNGYLLDEEEKSITESCRGVDPSEVREEMPGLSGFGDCPVWSWVSSVSF
jgi:hypothetical protein